MTNAEISSLIAEKVMGWRAEIVADPHTETSFLNYVDANGRGIMRPDEFSPPTSISDAWAVVEKMQAVHTEGGREFVFRCGLGWAHIEIREPVLLGNQHDRVVGRGEVQAETTPLAICLASLKALGVEVPQ